MESKRKLSIIQAWSMWNIDVNNLKVKKKWRNERICNKCLSCSDR